MWCVCILYPVMGSCILIGVGSVCIWIVYSTVRDIVDVYDWLRIYMIIVQVDEGICVYKNAL